MASNSQKDYDVFLSFRGEDTRHNIVSHLHKALVNKRIRTFKDERDLEDGDIISDQLIRAITASFFSVIVISENYATSSWCLEELRHIMELRSGDQIKVVPIFYKVEPSDVRNQRGSFEAGLQRHRDQDKILKWKEALAQVGNLSGTHCTTRTDEAQMVSNIVENIFSQLQIKNPDNLINLDKLVGMEQHMAKMSTILNIGSEHEVRMVGIWGMGGIGKTTIAKVLYDRFSAQFSARCFIEDIEKICENRSLLHLQETFLFNILGGQHVNLLSVEAGCRQITARLRDQKVFLVLDGVDKAEQVECLNDEDALQVFEKLAYRGESSPSDVIKELSKRTAQLAHGLPSALVTYASDFNVNTPIQHWKNELDILKEKPHRNLEEILMNSYNCLDGEDRIALLYVACLLNGYPFTHVTSLLDKGRPRISRLNAKSLVSISTDLCINMHALVVQAGREIVRQESTNRPFRQRCLWDSKEIHDVLAHNKGTEEIEGVTLDMCKMPGELTMSSTVFKATHSIKFLKFYQQLVDARSNVQLNEEGNYFPSTLRLLHWDAYSSRTLPLFQHQQLTEVDLRCSNLKRLWGTNVKLPNLRRLDVTGSENLIELPDLSTSIHFEELIVEGCIRLRNIPQSLMPLKNLTKLNTVHCDYLRNVSLEVEIKICRGDGRHIVWLKFGNKSMQFNNLRNLSVEGQILVKLYGLEGKTEHFSFSSKQQVHDELLVMDPRIRISEIKQVCDIQSLNIKQFSYKEFNDPFKIRSMLCLVNLTELKLVNLNMRTIPNEIDVLKILETLDLSGNDFEDLPRTLGKLFELKYLSLRNCRKIRSLPKLTQVKTLILSDCENLQSLLQPEENNTYSLLELWLDNCKNVDTLSHQLHHFSNLTYLNFSRNKFVKVPSTIRRLSSLRTLFLNNCKKLKSVEQKLPVGLAHLYTDGCYSLENVSRRQRQNPYDDSLPNICMNRIEFPKEYLLVNEEQDIFLYEGSCSEDSLENEAPSKWPIWVTLVVSYFRNCFCLKNLG